MSVLVLNPVSLPPAPVADLGVRLSSVAGTVIGYMSNNKPNAGVLLERVAERLGELYGCTAKHYNKGVPSLEASPEMVEEVVQDCDAAIFASFD
jgi:hypothetical protein